jgi:DHA2 family multidrug resistance protein-like MFS transporter
MAQYYPDDGFSDPVAWGALAGAAGALTWFTLRCLRRPDPILDVRLFARRPFSAGTLTALVVMLAMGAALLLVTQWLQLVQGHSPLRAGVYLLPLAAGAVITSPVAPVLTARIGARSVLAGGLVIAGAGFLLLDIAPRPLSYLPWVAAALALQGAGAGSLAIASALIMSGSPPSRAGSAAVIEETAYDLGYVLGIAILGSIASVIYRDNLHLGDFTGDGTLARQDAAAIGGATESLGGALEIARQVGLPELATRAQGAFAVSLAEIGLIGGVSLFVMAAAVFALTPRGVDITQQHR